jgi:hypothetical protein
MIGSVLFIEDRAQRLRARVLAVPPLNSRDGKKET